jgi:hypothetical protein
LAQGRNSHDAGQTVTPRLRHDTNPTPLDTEL